MLAHGRRGLTDILPGSVSFFAGTGDPAGSPPVAGVWKTARMSASTPRQPARDFMFFTLLLGSGELRMGGAEGWCVGVDGAEFSARRPERVRS